MNSEQIIQNLQSDLSKQDKYIDLLEKVNQQISYTWNPYLTILTIILIILALITLAAITIIYILGKDFRKRASIVVKQEIESRNKKIIEWEKKANQVINKYEKKLQDQTDKSRLSKEDIEKIKKDLDELKKEKDNISISSGIGLSDGGLAFGNKSMPCDVCGRPVSYLSIDNVCGSCKNWPGNPPGINIS